MSVFKYDHDVLSYLVELMEQESYFLLVKVLWKVESQTILKIYDSSHSQYMTKIKSNRGEHENSGVCVSNHSVHVIQIM